jgi:hypothetical protein
MSLESTDQVIHEEDTEERGWGPPLARTPLQLDGSIEQSAPIALQEDRCSTKPIRVKSGLRQDIQQDRVVGGVKRLLNIKERGIERLALGPVVTRGQ